MARHRSPQGRRAHLGPPLSAVLATAGAGGATRTVAYRSSSSSTSSLPVRFIATAVAGTALAAAGQHLLVQAVPMAANGAAALRAGVNGLLGSPAPATVSTPDVLAATPIAAASASASLVSDPIGAVAPVGGEPVIADAAELVKAADLQRVAAEQAAAEADQARLAEQARAEAQARAADAAENAPAGAIGEAAAAAAAASGGVAELLVDGGRFTSGFGLRDGRSHEGIDIAAPIGTPIHVPLDGIVIDSGPATGFGLWVRVQHADGTITTYGHINRSLVSVGDKVDAGQVIAEVGNRGESTGPHLHFEVTTPAGQKINPRPWLDDLGVEL